jgi:23S rRNA A2030 N6-methylase RlmJ
MLIVNPPWKLEEDIAECIPWLTRTLAADSRGTSDYGRLLAQEAEGGC